MVVKRRKKVTKHRGATTHGWGSKKKHRGAGNRGGRGFTGRGKHSDHRKMEYTVPLGKHGFKMHGAHKDLRAINIEDIQKNMPRYVHEGKAQKKGDIYIVDSNAIGYQKILGTGQLKLKLHITAQEFSQKAEDKIKKAGGEALTPKGENS
ncbi:MAG TPA: uL15m family ribosomal protein [Candidatus Nanoarchaeia archaeon]|nr:uL15m family ribosomal protein [Candidatus Nanoarchaeia archaeon]